jgi:mannose-1-phosphate guanylyltransferase
MTDIAITDLTSGSLDDNNDWSGTGVFDKLIEAVNKNIEGQYNKGRISGSDYANVYLGSMQSVLTQSIAYVLQEKLTEEELKVLYVDRILKDKQAAKLGMDDAMKIAEKARSEGDGTVIYTPRYIDQEDEI